MEVSPLARIARLTRIGLLVVCPVAGAAQAAEWTVGNVQVRFDATVSQDLTVRTAKPDPALIGIANGGKVPSLNADDGTLNYRRSVVAAPLSALGEFEVQRDGWGFLLGGLGYYDFRNARGDGTERTPLSLHGLDLVGRGGRLLNAYLFGRFELAGSIVTFRAGDVALNWGEATLIPNGLSVVSPYDLTRLHSPFAELRSALLPVPMVNASLDLAPGISIEGFVQLKSETLLLDPVGSFFSTTDIVGAGGSRLFLGYQRPATDLPPFIPGTFIPRGRDRGPGDFGQYGLAIRWTPPKLGGSEFGLYGMRYNSRLPLLSLQTGSVPSAALGTSLLAAGLYAQSSRYVADYPDGIKLVGVSVSAPLPAGITLRAETSWRFDQPLQIDPVQIGYAALSPVAPAYGAGQLGLAGFGQSIQGWRRSEVATAIASLSRNLPGVLGSDQLEFLLEGGLVAVPSLPGRDLLSFGGPGVYTSGNGFFTAAGLQPYTSTKGFATRMSGGYRLVAQLDYYNAIGAVGLFPRMAFAHDVGGTTPGPLLTFVQDRKALSMGVSATWLSRWRAAIEYTRYFGAGGTNLLRDRDNVSLLVRAEF